MKDKDSDVSTIEAEVLDAKGCPITKGSIVGMSEEDGYWSKYQGLVVEPNSKQDTEYTVAVFFNSEVSHHNFHDKGHNGEMMDISDWDNKYAADCKKDYMYTLQHEDILETCPRIVFFKPKELVVQTEWKVETLASRLFNTFHSCQPFRFKQPIQDFLCFCNGCKNQAKKLAFYNYYGNITNHYVCDDCFRDINGIRGKCRPKEKKPILLLDGSPAPRPS